MIIWRDAVLADLETVVALIRQDSRTPIDQGASLERLTEAFHAIAAKSDAQLIVGERDGHVVATYQLFVIDAVSLSAPRRVQIEDVRVDAAVRRQGIGASLMADAEARASAAGATLVQLMSSQARHDTHRFYQSLGYTPSHFGFKKPI